MKLKYIMTTILLFAASIIVYYMQLAVQKPEARLLYYIVPTLCAILVLAAIYVIYKTGWDIGKAFVILSVSLGILYMAANPIYRSPDENVHLFRIVEVSMGHFDTVIADDKAGRELPAGFQNSVPEDPHEYPYRDMIEDIRTIPLDKENPVFTEFPFTALYSPIPYIPQSIGVWLGLLLNLPPIIIAFMGRIMNLLLFIVAGYFVIKNLKYNRFIFVLLLTPMSLHTAASLSPDVMTNMVSLLLFSLVLKWREKPVNSWQIAVIAACCLTIALCKIVYLPLCGLVFLLKYKSKFSKLLIGSGIILVSAALNLIWLAYSAKYLPMCYSNAQPDLQLNFILTKPWVFIGVLLNSFSTNIDFYVRSMLGTSLGYFDVPVHQWIADVLLILSVYLLLRDNPYSGILKRGERMWTYLIIAGTVLLIHASLYIQYTSLYSALVGGVQGRYLLPVMPLLLMLAGKNKQQGNVSVTSFAVICLCLADFAAFTALFARHV